MQVHADLGLGAYLAPAAASTLCRMDALESVLESVALPAEKVAQLTNAFERIDKDSDGAAAR